jgi:histidinol-phosphate aminotransferase
VERGDSWVLDVGVLGEAARGASLVVLDRPNNPTGSMLAGSRELLELASEVRGFVVVDEAYYEFSGETLAGHVPGYENLVVVRTLSKAFSLAGLRVGYIVAPKHVAAKVRQLNPYPASRPSLAAVAAYTQPQALEHLERVVGYVRLWRERVRGALARVGVKAYRSEANFLLIDTGTPGAVGELARRGVRTREVEVGSTMVRASIGRPWENRMLVKELAEIAGASRE